MTDNIGNTETTVFEQLEQELNDSEISLQKLESAVSSFVKLNGSGNGVRNRLRDSLSKEKFLTVCELLQRGKL